jgi:pimeloyl-ACP methyl ester carboxylesterase
MEVETTFLNLRSGRRQVVYRAGDHGDHPPLVWLHSLYGVEADRPIVEALAEHHHVYAPLAPGFTDLAELEDIRDIHDLALHYDDIMDALELDEAVVAGHSFGAMIAAELAAHVPARVSRLILASPLGLWNDRHPVADLFGIPAAEVPGLLYANPTRAPGSAGQPDVESIIALTRGMTTVARFLWPIPDRGLSRRLYRVRAPTLVIHGALDRFVPVEYAAEFAEKLPAATTRIIPDAGHLLTVEALDPMLRAMADFLSSRVEAHA